MSKDAAIEEEPPTPGKETVLTHVLEDLKNNAELCRDLKSRAERGKEEYGTYLMTHNGRDPIRDAYLEALDMIMYIKQAQLEGTEMSLHVSGGPTLIAIQLKNMLYHSKKPPESEEPQVLSSW
jgi:hypothetical protein